MDFQQLSYNDHTLFHMLRHFEYMNADAKICLIDRGYSNQAIEENLLIPGSKFHKGFATDIKSLIEQLKFGLVIQIHERKKYQEIVVEFDKTIYPRGIGTVGVSNKKELDELKASIPILKMNRGWQLWHATVAEIPICHQLTMVIKKQTNSYFLITAFPGKPTLPLPQKKMNPLDLELSKQYWSDKVFLEK